MFLEEKVNSFLKKIRLQEAENLDPEDPKYNEEDAADESQLDQAADEAEEKDKNDEDDEKVEDSKDDNLSDEKDSSSEDNDSDFDSDEEKDLLKVLDEIEENSDESDENIDADDSEAELDSEIIDDIDNEKDLDSEDDDKDIPEVPKDDEESSDDSDKKESSDDEIDSKKDEMPEVPDDDEDENEPVKDDKKDVSEEEKEVIDDATRNEPEPEGLETEKDVEKKKIEKEEKDVDKMSKESDDGIDQPKESKNKDNLTNEDRAFLVENVYSFIESILLPNQKIKMAGRGKLLFEDGFTGITETLDTKYVIEKIARETTSPYCHDYNYKRKMLNCEAMIDALDTLDKAVDKYDLSLAWNPKKVLTIIGNKTGTVYNIKHVFNQIEVDSYDSKDKVPDPDQMREENPSENETINNWIDGVAPNPNSDMNPIVAEQIRIHSVNENFNELNDPNLELEGAKILENKLLKIKSKRTDDKIDDIIDDMVRDIEEDDEIEDELFTREGINEDSKYVIRNLAYDINLEGTDPEDYFQCGRLRAYIEDKVISKKECDLIKKYGIIEKTVFDRINDKIYLLDEDRSFKLLNKMYNRDVRILDEAGVQEGKYENVDMRKNNGKGQTDTSKKRAEELRLKRQRLAEKLKAKELKEKEANQKKKLAK